MITHSQGGPYGWQIGDKRSDKVKGILAIEPEGPPLESQEFRADGEACPPQQVVALNLCMHASLTTYSQTSVGREMAPHVPTASHQPL